MASRVGQSVYKLRAKTSELSCCHGNSIPPHLPFVRIIDAVLGGVHAGSTVVFTKQELFVILLEELGGAMLVQEQ